MHDTFDHSGRAGYRLLHRDWIDGRELYVEPNPSRLRAACLMIYVGLLLSLGAIVSSFPAAAQPTSYMVTQNRGVADGLQQDAVQAIARDSRGFTRVGTVDGLNRFEDSRFGNFWLMDDPGRGTSRITAPGAGAESRGLVRLRNSVFQGVPICDQRCRVPAFSGDSGGVKVSSPGT